MMTGKAYLSAVRGHLLVEIALRTIILSELYDFDLPKEKTEVSENCSTMDIDIEDSTKFVQKPMDFRSSEEKTSGIQEAVDMFDDLLNGIITYKKLTDHKALKTSEKNTPI